MAERESVEITVTYRVSANPSDWDIAHGTNGATRADDMREWLDNMTHNCVTLPSDIAGEVKVTTEGAYQPA